MIKVSSRFLAVLMLAVLAFTDITTTSAFAQRGAVHIRPAVPELRIRPAVPELRIRPPGIADVPWRNPMTPGRVLEDFDLDLRPGGTCNVGCESNRLRDLPPQEESPQSEGVLRPYRSPAPVLR
jgi:hypothetical protein